MSTPVPFEFPARYMFPPMFTLQPTLQTRTEQFRWWADVILRWCQHGRLWRLVLVDAVETPLFHNAKLRKRLTVVEVRQLIDWMARDEGSEGIGGGGRRAEWADDEERAVAWIYWRRPEEWAELIAKWVDDTGQKNSVLTIYELTHGEAVVSQEFYGMEKELLQKSLNVLVKRGRAQIFGSEDEQGVKFF